MKFKTTGVIVIALATCGALLQALPVGRTASLRETRASASSQSSRSVWSGVYADEQAQRGAESYRQECASCHGIELAGNGEEAPALTGAGFLANWNGLTVGDLFERVRVSMPPNKKGKVSRERIVDILTHVLSVNGFPAGKSELERETELMRQIVIEPTRPQEKR